MIYGYARVSSVGQDHADQVAELMAAGCSKVFYETASAAAGRKRPQLAKALAALRPGDVFMVVRLSRLARSTIDGLNTLAAVTAKGAAFRSLREEWADSTTAAGRFLVTLMSGLAELDREMILERTAEGRQAAKARGVRLGRRPTLTARQRAFIRQQRAGSPPAMSLGQLSALLQVSRSTVCRAAKAPAEFRIDLVGKRGPQIDIEDLITPGL